MAQPQSPGLGPLANIAFVMITINVANKLKLMDEENVNIVRAIYAASQIITLAVLFFVRTKINSKNDETTLTYTPPKQFGAPEPEPVTTTNHKYDLAELSKSFNQTLIQVGILGFLHVKFGYIQPLLLQAVLPLKNLFSSPLVQIYVLGKDDKAQGLKRPWIAPSPFAGLTPPAAQETTPEPTEDTTDKKDKKDTKKDK
ncbi:inorganic phosphate transporter Pho88 [Paraphysoderma sedebokerense]|nr:inorganic phosphate transporter Pho88 [Paraphysoderma sedebokerense]